MSSFRLPDNMLHSNLEPQWFPRPREETESSLETLERKEEAQLVTLRRTVLPTAPEPIGLQGGTDAASSQALAKQRAILQQQKSADVQSMPTMLRFWDKYGPKVTESRVPAPTLPDEASMESDVDISHDSSTVMSPPRHS